MQSCHFANQVFSANQYQVLVQCHFICNLSPTDVGFITLIRIFGDLKIQYSDVSANVFLFWTQTDLANICYV